MPHKPPIILAIESSCDETSAALIKERKILANITATQAIHEQYGGVVPELASRAHQSNIVPVVSQALNQAGIQLKEVDAVAFTRGPGLIGALLVGTSFAKGLALALNKPLIEVNHMQAHVLAHFIEQDSNATPEFPFICLTVSGGHTQLVLLKSPLEMEILGETIDDAAGEAFDKAAKILGLPYPGGPLIDKYARIGNPKAFSFPEPKTENELDFSFSGLKTSILYFVKKNEEKHPGFVQENLADICASVQHTIVSILIKKALKACKTKQVKQLAIAGGVSANSGLRVALLELKKQGITPFVPPFEYCTDNAGMIAIAAYFKYQQKLFVGQEVTPLARMPF